MARVNGDLYLVGNDGATGDELWRSDGTTPGTTLVKDIVAGLGDSDPTELIGAGGLVFFSAFDPVRGRELWKSDGTEPGTVLVQDVYPGSPGSWARFLTRVGADVFLLADSPTAGAALWKSDGTSAGTVQVKDIFNGLFNDSPGFGFGNQVVLQSVNGKLFFLAFGLATGPQLWTSDGTETGTVVVTDIHNGRGGSEPQSLTDVNGRLFFVADDRAHGFELWTSDGSAVGTALVKDIAVGPSGAFPQHLVSAGGRLFFTALNQLWTSDGGPPGTVPVKDFGGGGGAASLGAVGAIVYLAADDGGGFGAELWRSDGTEAGTVLLKDIAAGPAGSNPRFLTKVNGTLFFVADDGIHGAELWKSDGTEAGTALVKDILAGPLGSQAGGFFAAVNGITYFAADDGIHGRELWKSDGTEAGTVLVKDIEGGPSGSDPSTVVSFGGAVHFSAFRAATGQELWRTDGTAEGTVLVLDPNPGVSNSGLGELTVASGGLFFVAGGRPWRTDGTAAGTVRLNDSVSASNLTEVAGALYFAGWLPETGLELWRSDGTPAGTSLVKDLTLNVLGSAPQFLTAYGDRLFFSADDGLVGRELWALDTDHPTVNGLLVMPHQTSADVSAAVASDGGSPIIERGFLVSATNPTPEMGGSGVTKVTVAGTTGSMAATLGGLSPNTPYFLRAFARTANGVGYDQTTFLTEPITGPSLSISDVTALEGNAGSSNAVFSISLSSASAQTVTVQVETLDGSATAGNDYEALASTVIIFNPGVVMQTVTAKVYGDAVLEGVETFKLVLSAPLNAILSDGTGTGVIVDDEPPSRVFVSPSGSDANDCSTLTAPCRSIGGALSKVAVDGEVIVLSTGEYETAPLVMTKGVKITAPVGVVAFIRQPITVNAPGARVALRGLHMKGGGGGDAVTLVSAGALSMEEITIDRWTSGLRIGGGSASQVTIVNSMFRQSGAGVRADVGTTATVSVEGNRFEGNSTGIDAGGGSFFLRETTFAGNGAAVSAEQSVFDIQRSEFLINQTGIAPLTGGVVRLSRSLVFGNGVGLSTMGGGTILLSGTNVLRGNVTNTSGAIGTIPEQ